MSEALTITPAGALAERPEQTIARIKQAREMVVAIQREIMTPGVHYGIIPGCAKPSLLKEGADVLNMAFRLAPQQEEVLDLSGPDERKFQVTVGLCDESGRRLGFGVGVCSTSEEKYRWRKAYQSDWNAVPADRRRSKEKPKRDGGGTYTALEVRTEPADLENTVLQMAVKRALVQATRQVHAVSDIFADITVADLPEELRDSLNLGGNKVGRPKAQAQPPAQTRPPASTQPVSGAPSATPPPAAAAPSGPPAEHAPLITEEKWAPIKKAWHDKGAISGPQAKRLIAIGMQSGWSAAEIRAEVQAGLSLPIEAIPFKDPYDLTCALFSVPRPQP